MFEAPRIRNFIPPPLFCTPSTPIIRGGGWGCDPECLLQGPETSKLPREGAKGVFVYVDQLPVALVENRVALVVQTLGRSFLHRVKTPFAPSPNDFGQF